MKQVLQNHSPEYVVVDEISTAAEAEAAWSISQRGVCLIATCHGESLAGVLQNQTLNLLVGGTAQAFLSNEERRLRNKLKKTVLERPYPSPFKFVAELNSRNTAHVYVDVNQAVDCLLDEQDAKGNASIGTTVVVNQPPSERLMALLLEKQRRGQSTLDHHQIRKCATDQRDCTEDQTDDAGSESFGNTWIEERRSASSSFRRKKSDQRLLEDLQRFL
ncbi:hypothetical protein TRVL_07790 [Trypanosoma vivax]|nr:hypothetical protein TRVL_07790 [Trypanosoma vivax]